MLQSVYTTARDALTNKISEVRQLFSTIKSNLKNSRKQTHQRHYKLKNNANSIEYPIHVSS